MAKFEYYYKDLEERKLKIEEAEGEGLRMLHDDFDADWKSGDEPHGTLTFTNEPYETVTPVEPPRDLAAEIDDLKARVKVLEK